jgi:hypothetical protein
LLATASEEGANSRKGDGHEQDSDHVATLREDAVEYQTDSDSQAGISLTVDRLVAESKKLNYFGVDGY